MNSNLEMMLDSVILESVKNSIINENRLEKEGKWSVYLLYNGVGEGGGHKWNYPIHIHAPQPTP